MNEYRDWLRLILTPGLGPRSAQALLSAFGMPDQILAAPRSLLAEVVGPRLAAVMQAPVDEEALTRNLHWLAQPGRHLLTLADDRYPRALLDIHDPPIALFAHGRLELLDRVALGVVGSRHPSAQGLAIAESFARCIAGHDITIVSGLAWGIDAAAHRGALRSRGSTIAVMATGPDQVYPSGHRALAEQIRREGLIVTECSVGTSPIKGQFVRRNRLIAGLSSGVLVVEAALDSGSLTTARQAAEQGREVFAVPGSIHSPTSRGCHALIREGAKLVDDARLVLEELPRPAQRRTPDPRPDSSDSEPGTGAAADHRTAAADGQQAAHGTPHEQVFAHIGFEPVTPDMLCLQTRLTPDMVSAMLTLLEIEGRIRAVAGGAWQRTP